MASQKYSKLNLFIRSLIFSTCSIISMLLFSFVCVASYLVPLRWRHRSIRTYLRFYLWMLASICHIKYEVKGLENVPKDRVGVVLCKHSSAWETFYLPLAFHDPAVIAKRELSWIPFFGWGLASSDPILINRSDKVSAMQQIINKGKRALDNHRWILVFPEGTRVPVGEVGRYHLGGARLAVANHVPVIPVAHNAGYFWRKRGFIKQPGTVQVVIGPLMETEGRTPEAVMESAKTWIESTVASIGGLVDESASQ